MTFKIGTKVNLLIILSLMLVGGSAILFSASALRKEGALAIEEYRTGVMKEKTQMLKEMVRIVYAMAGDHLKEGQAKGMPVSEMQQKALHAIGTLRYGEDNSGYFFIYDSAGINILDPVKPEIRGTSMINARDPNGKYFLKEIIKAAKSSLEGGMVEYIWTKPGHDKPVPKISFSKHFDAWDWNIGTGIYTDDVDAVLDKRTAGIKSEISSQVMTVSLVISAFMALSLVAGYLVIAKGVVGPIRNMIEMLRDIAEGEGDLTQRIVSTSGDETRELADWFNLFIGNVQSMITDIKGDSVKLTESSQLLAGISEQMNEVSEGTASRANTVAAASEEMSANMTSVAAAMEEASTNIGIVASASEEMTATISEIASNAENARGITDNAVSQTRNASDRVNEIKELANQTSEATGEIKTRVQGIQDSTQLTVTEIASIATVVSEINEIVSTIATAVEEQSVTTKEIAANVFQASQGIGEVNENVSQASIATGDVSQEISEVTVSSGEMTRSSSQVKMNARELSELAGHLSDMVGKFKV